MLTPLIERITDEKDAERLIRSAKETFGVKCTKCGSIRHIYDTYNRRWTCKDCGRRQALASETIMHGTQMPCLYWLKVIYCFANCPSTTKVQLIQDYVEPGADKHRVWEMLQKIRSIISQYVDNNIKAFTGKKFKVKVTNPNPRFEKYYTDEMKFKIYIQEKDDWEKFTALLNICLASRPPFKHQTYKSYTNTIVPAE